VLTIKGARSDVWSYRKFPIFGEESVASIFVVGVERDGEIREMYWDKGTGTCL
jgi:hypothetical protein